MTKQMSMHMSVVGNVYVMADAESDNSLGGARARTTHLHSVGSDDTVVLVFVVVYESSRSV
jgi:hypothetical protein